MNKHEKTYRLFIATFIDKEIVDSFFEPLSGKLSKSARGKLIEPWNFHFTWHFLGDCTLENLNNIKTELSSFFKVYKDEFNLKGIEAFPEQNEPKVIYMNIDTNIKLFNDIYKAMKDKIKAAGIKPEKKKFIPHITLMRIKEVLNKPELVSIFNENLNTEFGTQKGFRINLVSSVLTSNGPIYKIIA